MEQRVILSWQAEEPSVEPKSQSWYWAVGIVAGAIAIAAVMLQDYLFSVIAVIGGFGVMLLGSKPPERHTYRLTERGLMIGPRLIPYRRMAAFAIHEGRNDEGPSLRIETDTIMGIVAAPLGTIDYRRVQMELKNKNVEEVEALHSFVNGFANGIGL